MKPRLDTALERLSAWIGFLLALGGGLGAAFFASSELVWEFAGSWLGRRWPPLLVCVGVAAFGAALGVWQAARLARWHAFTPLADYDARRRGAWVTLLTGTLLTWGACILTNLFLSDLVVNSHGRRLRRFRRVRVPLARRAPRPSVVAPALVLDAPAELRGGLAQAWRETACKEHAAIASFAQLSLDLLTVGAPPYLLESTHADARDEVRHVATCFDIARAYDAEAAEPAPFRAARLLRPLARTRAFALVQIALDSLADGVLNEGMSARVLARLAARAESPELADCLRTMAVDEARHASHGWRIVEWCLEAGGEPVRRAVLRAAAHLPTRMEAELDAAAASGAWERYGVQGKALEREAFERTRAALVQKLATLSCLPLCA